MVPTEPAHRLGQSAGAVDRCANLWNDVLSLVFAGALLAACAGGTVGLEPSVSLVWLLFGGWSGYVYARWRDQLTVDARLDGTVLTVRRRGMTSRCDLAAVGRARLGSNITARGDRGYYALSARDARTGERVRYVLRADDCESLSSEDLCLLAGALEANPSSAPAHRVAERLRRMARDGYEKTSSEMVDWSHRKHGGD